MGTVMEWNAIITCPRCGFVKSETMLSDTWVVHYECTSCGAVLRPLFGQCCVFCSFSDQHCPSKQREEQADGDARG